MDESRPPAGGLYIHVAYCRSKCIYCDFYSAGGRIADWPRYVDALIEELNCRIAELPQPLRTVYLGGGTPSLMPADDFIRLAEAIRPHMDEVEEFTIEANPDDINDEILEIWKREGVNRLSLGIQTLHDHLLKRIGRRHDASAARRAYTMARNHFSNISVDLMFGLPGQTLGMWREDLQEVIYMHPEHISAYSLMYEEGTALTLLRDQGRLPEAEDGLTEKMFQVLVSELKDAGYEHYEISNFVLPGYRSRHNSSYWRQLPYLGIGPSAHSYDGHRIRSANPPDLKRYLDYWTDDNVDTERPDMINIKEELTNDELREEYIMTRLRTCEGIPMTDFIERFGRKEWEKLLHKANTRIESGHLLLTDTEIRLSESAILISDAVIVDLI